MSSYTISITPEETGNASATMRVDVGAAGTRITELTVRAGNGEGILFDDLPGFDLGRLLRTIVSGTTAAPAIEVQTPADEPEAEESGVVEAEAQPEAAESEPAEAAAVEEAAEPAQAQVTEPSTPTRRAAKSARTARAQRGTRRAKKAAASAAPATKSAGRAGRGGRARKAAAAATAATEGRAYRRMPTDIIEAFQEAGSVSAVAAHYGVPRHTAQGWIGRLRKEGKLESS